MNKKLLLLSLCCSLLIGCAGNYGPKQTFGGVLGGVGGAVVGAQFGKGNGRLVGTALGALLGTYAGSSIGQSLDEKDTLLHQRASQTSLNNYKSGQTYTWNNPDSGHSGSFTPIKTYQTNDGTYCREFTQQIVVAGKSQQGYGTACRQVDGSWKINNQS